ncbi:MAG: Gfo/Idh/MocA family oxidoreductase [Trueperaceae bacterium]
MLNIAVLGSGFMGATHARAFAKQPDVNVVGVSSRSKEKAARLAGEVGAKPFADSMELALLDEVDAVSVTLPTNLHKRFTIAALEAGKHVLVEKPMALTTEECDEMIAVAKSTGRVLMVAHLLRFWPEYVALANVLDDGTLGKPLSAIARRLSTRPNWGDWFSDPAFTGGAVHDMQIHDLDALNWLFGRPETVYARGHKGPQGGWDHVLSTVDFGDVNSFVESSVMMPEDYPFTMSLWVLCERGSIEFTFRAGGTGVETGGADGTSLMVYESGKPPRSIPTAGGDGYENEVAYFVQCLSRNREPEKGTAVQGRLAVEVALASRKSLETGEVVTL